MTARRRDRPFRFEGMEQAEVQRALEAIATWDDSLYALTRDGDVEVAFTSACDGQPAIADFPSCPRPDDRALRAIAALVRRARPTGHVWDDCDGRGQKAYPEGLTLVIPGQPASATARAALGLARESRLAEATALVRSIMRNP